MCCCKSVVLKVISLQLKLYSPLTRLAEPDSTSGGAALDIKSVNCKHGFETIMFR